MIPSATITLCGREVEMIYCAAAETGFEDISGKSVDIFVPDVDRDEKGKVIKVYQPAATKGDYLKLGFAAIVAAYARKVQDPPITDGEIIYEATPEEIMQLITAVVSLRNQWYHVPEVVKPETDEQPADDDRKNA